MPAFSINILILLLMVIITNHQNKLDISKKLGVTLSLISYALRFRINSLTAMRIRHLAMNCCGGYYLPD